MSLVFQNIDPPLRPASVEENFLEPGIFLLMRIADSSLLGQSASGLSVSYPPNKGRGYKLAGRRGGKGGGAIFWKTRDIGLHS
jgi:hypothetical protein